MKIQLIQPAGEIHRHQTGIFKRSLRYAPLTLTTLAALVPDELQAEVAIQDEGVQPLNLDFEADLVGLSAITGTAPRTYAIADQLRKRGLTVVLGGVHPTLLPDEAAPHADSVVVGYAEDSWPQLLRDGPLHSPEFGACRLAHELVEGRCYSVILTTGGGLYRYRLNDSVKVVGFEAGCPRVIFVGRFDRTSDLVGEKLSEPHVRQVLERVFRGLGVVPKFAMVVPIASAPPHYRLYLQLQPPHSLNTSLGSIAEQLQSGLNENPHYQHAVRLGQLGPIDVQLLDPDGESGSRIYERRCLSAGQRAGDIKPHALDSRDRWADAFDAAVQPPSDPRSMMPRSSRPLKRG